MSVKKFKSFFYKLNNNNYNNNINTGGKKAKSAKF